MSEETKSQFQRTSSQLSSLSPPLEKINLEQTQKCPCVQLFRTICLLGITQSIFFSFFDYLSLKSSTSLYFDISECCIWIIIFITGHFQPASINFTFFAISILKSLYSVHYYLPHLEEINADIDNFSAIIVYCFIHFIQIILTSLTIKIKLLRLLALNISIIYFFIYVLFFFMGEKEHADILGVGAIIGLCAVNISLHFTDNSKKATNAEHLQLMKQIDGWRTLLYEVFPLGVVIAKQPYGDEKTLSVIYSNQACHEILKGSKNQQIDDELKRIFVDSPKCQMSDGYHSPNKNTRYNNESSKKNNI